MWRRSPERWRTKDHVNLSPLLAGIAPNLRIKCAVRVSFGTQLDHVSISPYRAATDTHLPKLMLRQLLDTGLFLGYPFCQRQHRLPRLLDQAEDLFGAIRPIQSRDKIPALRVIQMLAIPVDHLHASLAARLCDFPQRTNHGRMWLHNTIPPLNRDLGRAVKSVRCPWLCRQGRVNPPRSRRQCDLHEDLECISVDSHWSWTPADGFSARHWSSRPECRDALLCRPDHVRRAILQAYGISLT
jgi:hypothetical protein